MIGPQLHCQNDGHSQQNCGRLQPADRARTTCQHLCHRCAGQHLLCDRCAVPEKISTKHGRRQPLKRYDDERLELSALDRCLVAELDRQRHLAARTETREVGQVVELHQPLLSVFVRQLTAPDWSNLDQDQPSVKWHNSAQSSVKYSHVARRTSSVEQASCYSSCSLSVQSFIITQLFSIVMLWSWTPLLTFFVVFSTLVLKLSFSQSLSLHMEWKNFPRGGLEKRR